MELIRKKALAEIVGVTPAYITKLIKKGVFDKCLKDNQLLKDCALKAYYNFKKQIVQNDSNSNINYDDELKELLADVTNPQQKVQIIKDFWVAKLNEFKYESEKGKYYLKEDIDKKAKQIITITKNKFLALGNKIAPLLITCETIEEIKFIIDNAVYEILTELGKLDEMV